MSEGQEIQTLNQKAKEAYEIGDFVTAAKYFSEAADACEAAGNALDAAEQRNNASVSFLQSGNAKDAYDVVKGTAEIFASNGDIHRKALALC